MYIISLNYEHLCDDNSIFCKKQRKITRKRKYLGEKRLHPSNARTSSLATPPEQRKDFICHRQTSSRSDFIRPWRISFRHCSPTEILRCARGWHGGVAALHKASITPSLQYHPALAGFHRTAISSQSDFTRHRRISFKHSSPNAKLHFLRFFLHSVALFQEKLTFDCSFGKKSYVLLHME